MERRVEFSEAALADLKALKSWLLSVATQKTTDSYMHRLKEYCLGFSHASERGHSRDDIRPGLRIVGFERRITIAFCVEADKVILLRLLYAGRDWETDLE